MARGRGLFNLITEPDNLRLAFKKAAKSKSDKPEVIEFRKNLDGNLKCIRLELINGDIQFGPYRFFTIKDPKERVICAAPFRDRVVHHAVINVCEPEFERYSIYDSYACRPGKGLHRALKRAQEFARKNDWYLKIDISKYFDSISHEILMRLLEKRFRDARLVLLFKKVIDSYEKTPGFGIPIGNLLSQHFANYYLGQLDHWLLEVLKVEGYLRYMDDMVIFESEKVKLKENMIAIKMFLDEGLQLKLKENFQLNRCVKGVPMLGFRIYPEKIQLSRRSKERFKGKLSENESMYTNGVISELELARKVISLVSFTCAADADGFRRLVIARRGAMSGRAPTA